MNIEKIFDFFYQYPTWFRVAVGLGIALAFLGLMTLREVKLPAVNLPKANDSVPTQANPAAVSISAPALNAQTAMDSLIAFFRYQKSLDGRFFELEEFLKNLPGKKVVWEGAVSSVSNQDAGNPYPILLIVSTNEGYLSSMAAVGLPEGLRSKAFSLRKGDMVRFSGTLSISTSIPTVKAEMLELIAAKS